MRKTAATALIVLGSLAGSAAVATSVGASAPPDTVGEKPETTEPTPLDSTATVEMAAGTEAGEPAAESSAGFEPVIVLDRNGAELAAITVVGVEESWTGHDDSRSPDTGNEYTRLTVAIESRIPRGVFEFSYYDFVAQDSDGFEIRADDIDPADGENPERDGSLAAGETAELSLTFEGLVGSPVVQVFYAPNDRLVTIAEL